METGPLMAINKEVDNVEEIQGSPGEEEEHAHTHQNPEKEHGALSISIHFNIVIQFYQFSSILSTLIQFYLLSSIFIHLSNFKHFYPFKSIV